MKVTKEIVIDGKGHLLGRLAAKVAKCALEGQRITIVRAEEIRISGSQYRNRLKFMEFLHKHSNSNPTKHSHIHYRSPAKMLKRSIRGMLPHKTHRGADALARINVMEGVPGKWNMMKRMVVPDALVHLHIKNNMPTTRLGDLASSVGWKADAVVQRLESVRKAKSHERYEKRHAAAADFRAKREAAIASAPAEIKAALNLVHTA